MEERQTPAENALAVIYGPDGEPTTWEQAYEQVRRLERDGLIAQSALGYAESQHQTADTWYRALLIHKVTEVLTLYLEPVTVLAAAAICTERARIGSSVFILGHRNPVVMAKMLTTIDTLSNGRLICGVGVGWWREEFAALGIPFEARGRRSDEMLRVFKTLWTDAVPRFEGEFYRLSDIGFAPKPVQKPHPPLWIGGHSQAALHRAVTLGDGWHASAQTPEQMRHSLERLRKVAEEAGRAFESLALSLRLPLRADAVQGSRQAIIDQYSAYKGLGLHHLVVDFRRDDLAQMLEVLDMVASDIRPAVQTA